MADLFDQLKSEGPVKKLSSSPAKKISAPKVEANSQELINKHKAKSSSKRRESLPSAITVSTVLKKTKNKKARSLSPKFGANSVLKNLKVKLERKKVEQFLSHSIEEHADNIRKKQEKPKEIQKHPKVTPTKAQQKLFEPLVAEKQLKAPQLKQIKVKPCRVRIHKDDLQKLAKEFHNKNAAKKDGKVKNMKRPAVSTSGDSPPTKKGKLAADKINKPKNNFFIKLNTSPSSKLERKLKNLTKSPSTSSEAFHNKMKNSKFNNATMPTKFSRSELFRSFGKRFFNVHVKIERCTHPLMLTFESNERARRLQSKRTNKSKNLSVSFSEQVEIFGDSSDPDDSCDEDFCAAPTNRNNNKKSNVGNFAVPATPVVMPARLKKIENGKVVDDIKLDPTLFLDPKVFTTSTPYSPGRKKRDHKSFSPLKDESSPSPRKEQLKLANERIKPSSLRQVNIEDDEDEDDDCEYIVPIEMPQRRTSCTSSNATLDDLTALPVADSSLNLTGIFNNENNIENINLTKNKKVADNNFEVKSNLSNIENGSNDSFQSARDNFEKNQEINDIDNQFSALRNELNLDVDGTKSSGNLLQRNGNSCNETGNKHVDDISINLFMEDSQTNDDNHSKSFVVSLINETIDKLSKDIEENTTDKHYTDTT